MEASWVQKIRNIANKQKDSIVDAKIGDDNHLILKKRDGGDVDAGLIKHKTPGVVVYPFSNVQYDEPDMYVSKDGAFWQGAASSSRFEYGVGYYYADAGCWTGDRFLLAVYQSNLYEQGTLLQSKDGGTWDFHPDYKTFNSYSSGEIYGMAASGTGLVVVIGYDTMGDPDIYSDAPKAVSYDFGETWKTIPSSYDDEDLYPFSGDTLYGICIKNDYEWIINDGSSWWYTQDGGFTWTDITDNFPANFEPNYGEYNSGMRFFDGCWWAYGSSSSSPGDSDPFNTPLIKSDDLINWVPVMTPWSGNYPPIMDYYSGEYYSGTIYNLVVDERTNTMCAVGYGELTSAYVMLSTDGGDSWFEVGYIDDDHYRIDYGFEGVYNWPYDWNFDYSYSGMAIGFGYWFVGNSYGSVDYYSPPFIRISLDGKTSEAVYPSTQTYGYGYWLISGGDVYLGEGEK